MDWYQTTLGLECADEAGNGASENSVGLSAFLKLTGLGLHL